jgi:hypothetical protein
MDFFIKKILFTKYYCFIENIRNIIAIFAADFQNYLQIKNKLKKLLLWQQKIIFLRPTLYC